MADDIGGVWRTIGGRHIFIKDGQDMETAMKMSGKFKSVKQQKNSSKKGNQQEEFENSKGQKTTFKKADGKEFKKKLDEAKETQPEETRWRVDNVSHGEKDYKGMKTYVTENGSTVAITKDGDIVSVCSKIGKNKDSARSLMEYAVKNGGTKLDSYDGNFEFYTKMGFEPVSWCNFDEEYAPSDWRKGKDNPEPIVFFKYTGEVNKITREEFYKKVKAAVDYDDAQKKRDRGVKRK